MPSTKTALRVCAALAAVTIATALAGCSAKTLPQISAPTMAPDQTLSEACSISGEEVDRITLEVERQVREGVEQAGADLAAGRVPSFEFLAGSVDETLSEVEHQINNPEVLAAVADVRAALQGFGTIQEPDSLIGAPGYIAALSSQLAELQSAGSSLQELCVSGG